MSFEGLPSNEGNSKDNFVFKPTPPNPLLIEMKRKYEANQQQKL
jgi:hypothetical protein